jgi:phosphoglucosamine mutase
MSLRFGTDGVRGLANAELTPELTLALGRAAARVFGAATAVGIRPRMLIGRDTRQSGPLLAAALTAGLCAEGFDVVDLGVLPTPGVAYASVVANCPAAMISASHNPFRDNGIKFFSAGGRKLPDDVEEHIETELDRLLAVSADAAGHESDVKVGAAVGSMISDPTDYEGLYRQNLLGALEGRRLDGLKVVLDCAHGATSRVAPAAFRALGAEVVVLADQPDGLNINDHCGSTHPESLQAAVVAHGAHAGFAFDGDADRMLAVDHTGMLVDGDQLMGMTALDLRSRGQLHEDTLVVTVMSNLGLKIAMRKAGINLVETAVGDRYVLEALNAGNFSLGGEQSGHIILTDHASTGDGTLAALVVADLIMRSGETLADHGAVMTRLPQVLKNVKGVDRARLETATGLWDAVKAAEAELGETGRVLLRPSGTEPLVRVMVEAPTAEIANGVCDRLCDVVKTELAFSQV